MRDRARRLVGTGLAKGADLLSTELLAAAQIDPVAVSRSQVELLIRSSKWIGQRQSLWFLRGPARCLLDR
jgi:hypothetical protein